MKIWGSPGPRAIIFATLIFATVFTAPLVHATPRTCDDAENTASTIPGDTNDSLYRVRVGDVKQGEIAGRFYMERNAARAESELHIVGDYDPDCDGWALVGHSVANNDGKILIGMAIIANVPYLAIAAPGAAPQILTPVSLAVVVANQDRLLKPFQSGFGTTVIIIPEPDEEPVQFNANNDDIIFLEDEINVGQPDAQSVVVTPQPADTHTIQQANDIAAVDDPVQVLPQGNVDGAVVVKAPGYFDSPGKGSADATGKVQNTFIIAGSIVAAVLLGIILLVRSLAIFNK